MPDHKKTALAEPCHQALPLLLCEHSSQVSEQMQVVTRGLTPFPGLNALRINPTQA